MLPAKVIVKSCEIAFPCTTLVIRFDNALLITVPVVGDDAAIDVLLAEQILRILFDLCPLHYYAVMGILHEMC